MARSPYLKFRLNRLKRQTARKGETAQERSKQFVRTYIIERWRELYGIRRFVISWWVLVLFIISASVYKIDSLEQYYLVDGPQAGGVYVEGVVGQVNNINPILQADSANGSVSALVFDGLFRRGLDGKLLPHLATGYEVSKDGKVYTVKLRDDVVWHDGESLDADDVVFTISRIQHPDTRSPYNASWQGVTVEAKDNLTILFRLPNVYVPFPQSLTIGIIPEHILSDIRPENLRASDFNQNPIGTGPFVFTRLENREESQRVELRANKAYFAEMPHLDRFLVRSYPDHETMKKAYDRGELSAIVGLRTFDDETEFGRPAEIHTLSLHSQVFAFYNNSRGPLKDTKFRQALSRSLDQESLLDALNNRFTPANAPILREQLGYSVELRQLEYDKEKANALLGELGYTRNESGRVVNKSGEEVRLQLVSQNSDEYPLVAQNLQRQWDEWGLTVDVLLVDFDEFQQSYLRPHNYDILLYGINIGADPDVFAYWHSSQAVVNGFNLSEWKSDIADAALEAGRTRQDKKLRAAKYETFLTQWRAAAPATTLYRPNFVYVTHPRFHGNLPATVVDPTDRYSDVTSWTIQTAPTLQIEVEDVLPH